MPVCVCVAHFTGNCILDNGASLRLIPGVSVIWRRDLGGIGKIRLGQRPLCSESHGSVCTLETAGHAKE